VKRVTICWGSGRLARKWFCVIFGRFAVSDGHLTDTSRSHRRLRHREVGDIAQVSS
jgi:hypothetical protein